MLDRITVAAGITISLICLLGAGTALASVKCQCNNGAIAHAMNSDFDDPDVAEACNDACSTSGGGRVWSVDSDRNDDDSDDSVDRVRPKRDPRSR